MEVDKLLHMTGVDHKASYAQHSTLQKFVIQASKQVIESSFRELCNSKHLPKCINIADLGCSSGPNALLAIEEIIPIVFKTCHEINKDPPSFQLFLNDLLGNDFNGIFKLLPSFYEKLENGEGKTRSCFIAAMPGSFYGRLFPEKSIHFVHSSFSLHWLSQVPKGLVSEAGEQLNKKNICFSEATSSPGVYAAYSDQFNKDFRLFLKMRSQEMALPGHLVLTFVCKNNEEEGIVFMDLIGIVIHDMVIEGLIDGIKLETFNLPSYFPSIDEVEDAIKSEGSFKVKHLDILKWSFNKKYIVNWKTVKAKGEYIATSMRAVYEPILVSHFGDSVMDDLFCRLGKKISEQMEMGQGNINSVLVSLVKE